MMRVKRVVIHKRQRRHKPITVTPALLFLVMLFGGMVGGIITAGVYADISIGKIRDSSLCDGSESITLAYPNPEPKKAVTAAYMAK